MDFSSSAIKGLVGVGAISTLAIGGTYLYNNLGTEKTFSDIDDFALNSKDGIWTWTITSDEDLTSKNNPPVEITGTLTVQNNNEDITWTCKIMGMMSAAPQTNKNLDGARKQLEKLKKEIGIDDNGKRNSKNNDSFQKFLENCIINRTDSPTEINSSSIIHLGDLELDGGSSSYKFKDEEFNKLHTSVFLTKLLKQSIGISECSNLENNNDGCDLDGEKLKKIRFANKSVNGLTVAGTNAKLKTKKTKDTSVFPNGLKFIFETTESVELKDSSQNTQVSLPKDSNIEFRLIRADQGNILEKAWTIENFGSKVNLTCTNGNQCNLPVGKKINFYRDSNNYLIGAAFTGDLTIEKDKENHNQGFKLKATKAIDLVGGTGKGLAKADKKIKNDDNISYQIKQHTVDGITDWFLSEVTARQ